MTLLSKDRRDEFATQFGKRLRSVRGGKKMTQVKLAGRAGYVPQTISNLERGLTVPSLLVVFILAEILEVHPKLLLFGEEG